MRGEFEGPRLVGYRGEKEGCVIGGFQYGKLGNNVREARNESLLEEKGDKLNFGCDYSFIL